MIPAEIERLWESYLAAERVRVRQETIRALESFLEAFLQLAPEAQHAWARQLAQRVVDQHENIPVRLPLFREVLFPALLVGVESSFAGAARWLAGFAQLLYKCPACRDQLPENIRSEHALLVKAIRDDPTDTAAKQRLLALMRSRFEYILHELPVGVLYGCDGATAEQCGELLEELIDYERLAEELGPEEEDRELIAEAHFHIPAYRCYLSELERFSTYEDFLATCERA